MPENSLPILHFVNLRGVGGVERNFAHFVGVDHPLHPPRHGSIAFSSIHPMIRPALRGRLRLYDPKRMGALKLPRIGALRRANLDRVIRHYRGGVALFWNRLGKFEEVELVKRVGLPCVHWERGWAWVSEDSTAVDRYLRSIDSILAVSHACRRFLQLRFGCTLPVTIVHDAVHPSGIADRARTLPAGRAIRLGCCARLIPIKGVSLAIHAVAELRSRGVDAELEIAGSGPLREALQELITRLGLEEKARLLGEVEDVIPFYDRIDILLHLALREAAGTALIEAQGRGCPVITSETDGIPEHVEHGAGGVVLPPTLALSHYGEFGAHEGAIPPWVYDPRGDRLREPRLVPPARVADAVERYLDQAGLYASDSAAGIARVARSFDADRVGAELIEVLAARSGR